MDAIGYNDRIMIEYDELPGTNIVELTMDGHIDRADMDAALERIEGVIQRAGSVRLLEHLRSFEGADLGVYWDELRFRLRHFRDVERAAFVADDLWIERLVTMAKPFLHGETRLYPTRELDAARAWLAGSSAVEGVDGAERQ